MNLSTVVCHTEPVRDDGLLSSNKRSRLCLPCPACSFVGWHWPLAVSQMTNDLLNSQASFTCIASCGLCLHNTCGFCTVAFEY